MPEKLSHEEEYFEQVDGCWRSQKRRGLSPLEFGFVEALLRAEVPLTAVILGIQRTFKNFKPKFPGDEIKWLVYCLPEIYAAGCELFPETHWEKVRCELQAAK